jgi:hypothetical protein
MAYQACHSLVAFQLECQWGLWECQWRVEVVPAVTAQPFTCGPCFVRTKPIVWRFEDESSVLNGTMTAMSASCDSSRISFSLRRDRCEWCSELEEADLCSKKGSQESRASMDSRHSGYSDHSRVPGYLPQIGVVHLRRGRDTGRVVNAAVSRVRTSATVRPQRRVAVAEPQPAHRPRRTPPTA